MQRAHLSVAVHELLDAAAHQAGATGDHHHLLRRSVSSVGLSHDDCSVRGERRSVFGSSEGQSASFCSSRTTAGAQGSVVHHHWPKRLLLRPRTFPAKKLALWLVMDGRGRRRRQVWREQNRKPHLVLPGPPTWQAAVLSASPFVRNTSRARDRIMMLLRAAAVFLAYVGITRGFVMNLGPTSRRDAAKFALTGKPTTLKS